MNAVWRQTGVPRLGRTLTWADSRPSSASPKQETSAQFYPGESLEAQIVAFRLRDGKDLRSALAWDVTTRPRSISDTETLARLDFLDPFPSKIPESAHLRLFLEFDWLSTELGSIDAWSTTLRRMVTFLMSDMRPAAMFWGENRITMYNEAYARTTGQKHPGMMGKKFAGA